MSTLEGPPLPILLRRLSETPPEFLACAYPAALVGDVLNDWNGRIAPQQLAMFHRSQPSDATRENLLQIVGIACWLLHDDWFREHAQHENWALALRWLQSDLNDLSLLLPAEKIISDPDRREEFARRALSSLNLAPLGETAVQARDRLQTLDSVERQSVILQTRKAQERAREIREEMARKAAEEAASRYGRE